MKPRTHCYSCGKPASLVTRDGKVKPQLYRSWKDEVHTQARFCAECVERIAKRDKVKRQLSLFDA